MSYAGASAAGVNSWGYPGTVDAGNAPVWHRMAGRTYFVADYSSGRVSESGPSRVSVGTGVIGGRSISDRITAAVPVTLPTSTTATWYLIVARRTWGTTAANSGTTFVALSTGASPSVTPAGRKISDAGTVDDQPLACVYVPANSTAGFTVRDVRAINTEPGVIIGMDDLVRSYLDGPGVRVKIGDTEWTRDIQSGSAVWVPDGAHQSIPTVSPAMAGAGGWTLASPGRAELVQDGHSVDLYVALVCATRGSSYIETGATGALNDTVVAQGLVASALPARDISCLASWNTNEGVLVAKAILRASGQILITWASPNASSTVNSGVVGLEMDFHYLTKTALS